MPHTFPVYVNSKNRSAGNADNFTIDFKDFGHKYQKAKISVLDVQIPFSFYNVLNQYNNVFIYTWGTSTKITITFDEGLYDSEDIVNNLQDYINVRTADTHVNPTNSDPNTYTVEYNDITKKIYISINNGANGNFAVNHISDGTNSLAINSLGWTTDGTLSTTPEASNEPIKLYPQSLYLYASGLSAGYNTTTQQISRILCKIPVVPTTEGGTIDYRPNFPVKYDVNNFLTSCSFHLEDENGNQISLQNLDWQFTLLLETEE
jgi:hypothetical protein